MAYFAKLYAFSSWWNPVPVEESIEELRCYCNSNVEFKGDMEITLDVLCNPSFRLQVLVQANSSVIKLLHRCQRCFAALWFYRRSCVTVKMGAHWVMGPRTFLVWRMDVKVKVKYPICTSYFQEGITWFFSNWGCCTWILRPSSVFKLSDSTQI